MLAARPSQPSSLAQARLTRAGVRRRLSLPVTALSMPPEYPRAGSWQVAHERLPVVDMRGSWNKSSPSAAASGVTRGFGGTGGKLIGGAGRGGAGGSAAPPSSSGSRRLGCASPRLVASIDFGLSPPF